MQPPLVEQIYEAAALPDLWPKALESMGRPFETKGGLIFANSEAGTRQAPTNDYLERRENWTWAKPEKS